MNSDSGLRSKVLLNLLAAVVLLAGVSWVGFLGMRREQRVNMALGAIHQPRETLRVLAGGDDSYYWQWVVRTAVARDQWRVRQTDLDNAPFGREMRWSSIPLWWMRGWIGIVERVENLEPQEAVRRVTEWEGPMLQATILILLTGLAWRARGPVAAILVGLAGLAPAVSYMEMGHGNVDHHGWQELASGGMLLSLYLGRFGWSAVAGEPQKLQSLRFLRAPGWGTPRFWFILAGLFGALGVAISADQQFAFLAVTGLGALVAQWGSTRQGTGLKFDARLWRDWALVGGIALLVLFGVENAPDFLISHHLEANHPFFGLAWIAGGMLLWEIRSEAGGWRAIRQRPVQVLLWLGFLSLPAAAYFFGGADWHLFRDRELSRLHEDVLELTPAWAVYDLKTGGGWWLYLARGGFAIGALLAGALAWSRARVRVGSGIAGMFAPLLLPVVFLIVALTFGQHRWLTLLSLSAVPVWLWIWDGLQAAEVGWRGQALCLLCCAGATGCGMVCGAQTQDSVADLIQEVRQEALLRSAGNAMAAQSGEAHPVVMGDTAFNAMVFVSPVHFVGTVYWENAEGLRDLVRFSTAESEAEFRQVLDRRNVSYVLVKTSPALLLRGVWARYGSYDLERVKKAYAWKLCKPGEPLPPWLQECTEELDPWLEKLHVRVFRYRKPAGS